MGAGLGEGGVVAAGAADDFAAGAAAARRQQVPVAFAIEVGRPRHVPDEPVGAGPPVEAVGAAACLDQVVLGPAVDRVVAEAAGDPDILDRRQDPSTRKLSLPGPRSAIASGPGRWPSSSTGRADPEEPGPIATPLPVVSRS